MEVQVGVCRVYAWGKGFRFMEDWKGWLGKGVGRGLWVEVWDYKCGLWPVQAMHKETGLHSFRDVCISIYLKGTCFGHIPNPTTLIWGLIQASAPCKSPILATSNDQDSALLLLLCTLQWQRPQKKALYCRNIKASACSAAECRVSALHANIFSNLRNALAFPDKFLVWNLKGNSSLHLNTRSSFPCKIMYYNSSVKGVKTWVCHFCTCGHRRMRDD